jgi:tRNA-specific 2-thiouridylase
MGISAKQPLYVCKVDAKNNIVFVGEFENLLRDEFVIQTPHFLLHSGEKLPENISVRVRSSCVETKCEIVGNTVKLKEKISIIAPGQAAVFYSGTRMLGGAWIEATSD